MIIHTIDRIADLAAYERRWNELAGGCPFRSWNWLTTWWKYYGGNRELQVLLVADEYALPDKTRACQPVLPAPEKLIGILPAYVEVSHARGRVLRLLGDGEVCSEHLDLLCEETHAAVATNLLAEFLISRAHHWDSIQFTALAENRRLTMLVQALARRECVLDRRPGVNLWSVPLPGTWDEFLAMQSKSHRKQLRQMKARILKSNRVRWVEVQDPAEFPAAWQTLIDLHQRRRKSLGEPGCFASPAWARFHREVALEMLATGMLKLSTLYLDQQPVAAEYHLAGHSATYAYQGGIEPDHVADEPGQLSLALCIERAIAAGHERFELLRGDEPYKPHWRAEPTATSDLQIISPRAWARWRHYSWCGIRRAGRALRHCANLLS